MGQSVKEALNQGPTQFIATPPHYVGAHCNHCGLSGQATAVHLRKTGGLRVYGPLTDTYVPKVFLLAYCRAAAFLGSHPAQVLYCCVIVHQYVQLFSRRKLGQSMRGHDYGLGTGFSSCIYCHNFLHPILRFLSLYFIIDNDDILYIVLSPKSMETPAFPGGSEGVGHTWSFSGC